jgi:hypothetical protein
LICSRVSMMGGSVTVSRLVTPTMLVSMTANS